MIHKSFRGEEISLLGMGNMRLPVMADGAVDYVAGQEIIDYAFEAGVNYFDTAYMYHGGESERFLGQALSGYDRDSYFLADKFPGFMLRPGQDPRGIFEEQLARCRTDHFDFYLMHNVNERSIETYTDAQLALYEYFDRERAAGRIRYLGFSSHGNTATLERMASFRDWDFAQIQLNYLDWTLQDAKRQYEILAEHDLPVIVMEPLRGGRLASLTPEADALLLAAQPERSIASWAFRWLMGLEHVQVVLSGMSDMAQIRDNVATFSAGNPLTADLAETLDHARDLLQAQIGVPCTACRYCTDDCPVGLDIPGLLNVYNNYKAATSYQQIALQMGMTRLGGDQNPADCIACGACAQHCPQSIDIPEVMAALAEAMG